MTDFAAVFRALGTAGVEFIIVGGVAASAHGSARETSDVDIVYKRSRENLARIVLALAPFSPYMRGAPPGLPFRWDVATLELGLNFTLRTSIGDVDLLGEIAGGGRYEDLIASSGEIAAFGFSCNCLNLETLIAVKRAAGRPKDLEVIAELETIRDLRETDGPVEGTHGR